MSATATHPSFSDDDQPAATVLLILRIGVVACFVGHGALGIMGVAAWTSYFGVVGIGPERALALMPWVGMFDVAMAISVLVYPTRAVVAYMVAWTMWTALLRPFAGESFWEAVERAGNYGAPLALLLLFAGGRGRGRWFLPRFREVLAADRGRQLARVLRVTTFLLLLGHGALNGLVQKPMFTAQYSMLGLPGSAALPFVGVFECLLALAVLLKPSRGLLFAVVAWKVASEALVPMAGSPFWCFIEHGGSYAAPLALAYLLPNSSPVRPPSAVASAL